MNKSVIILTRSSKFGQHCVAGIDNETGKWIRLVSDNVRTHGALSNNHIQYQDGSYCKPGNLVTVKIKGPQLANNQPENFLIDEGCCWKKVREYSIEEVISLYKPEDHAYIFGDTDHYITEDQIGCIGYSLIFVKVTNLIIHQVTNYQGKPKTKADFLYNRHYYRNMSVTDPEYYNTPNQTSFDEAILVLSLPESPFPDNQYFKFVAQIFPL